MLALYLTTLLNTNSLSKSADVLFTAGRTTNPSASLSAAQHLREAS